jgi:hypothetical protein
MTMTNSLPNGRSGFRQKAALNDFEVCGALPRRRYAGNKLFRGLKTIQAARTFCAPACPMK